MTDYVPPCADPANNPDDWFIEKDGKQYPDDPILTEGQSQGLYAANENATVGEMEEILHDAEEIATKDALAARRHAKDACHVDCYFRTNCLGVALETAPKYGTYGGYYREELEEIRKVRDERAERRNQEVD